MGSTRSARTSPAPSGPAPAPAAAFTASAPPAAPAPCRFAPCNLGRAQTFGCPLLVLFVIALNYYTVVLFTLSFHAYSAGAIVLVIFFHLLLVPLLMAWALTIFTDPGTPPEAWQREMAAKAAQTAGGFYVPTCRRSGLYKPPRSHFDSVTKRLTLNMDHFCPWVSNTVGFYNRKFFVLFLLYANLILLYNILAIAIELGFMWDYLGTPAATAAWGLPSPGSQVVACLALGIDVVVICMLAPFFWVHLKMAARNETTIDGSRFPEFELGREANLRQVLGANRAVWLLPLYCSGPDGDGVNWPRRIIDEDAIL
jgi:palmitoyltransferase